MRPARLAYLVTHPIQYQAPLLRRIAAEPDIELTVLFESDHSLRAHVDREFGRTIAWDVKLLDGYRQRFLRSWGSVGRGQLPSFWRPVSSDLATVLHAGGFDALWVHGYSYANHLAALMLAKRYGMKTFLRDEATELSRQRGSVKTMSKRVFFALVDRIVDRYLAIGRANFRHWEALGVAPGKIITLPYAVDGRLFSSAGTDGGETRRLFGIANEQKLIVFSAKLIDRKRPLDVLNAFERLQRGMDRRPALVMAGDGDLMPAIRQTAAKSGLQDVHIVGFQTQKQLAALYTAADVLVLPSERESWGLVVNEAMYGGCAIVASDRVGAAADLVRDNGIVYPVGDVAALTRALETVLESDMALKKMQRRSREIIAEWGFEQDVRALRQALDLPAR